MRCQLTLSCGGDRSAVQCCGWAARPTTSPVRWPLFLLLLLLLLLLQLQLVHLALPRVHCSTLRQHTWTADGGERRAGEEGQGTDGIRETKGAGGRTRRERVLRPCTRPCTRPCSLTKGLGDRRWRFDRCDGQRQLHRRPSLRRPDHGALFPPPTSNRHHSTALPLPFLGRLLPFTAKGNGKVPCRSISFAGPIAVP